MSFLSHAATFAGGFITGYICYGLTIGDDPNQIWETWQKSCGNVSQAANDGVETINLKVVQPIKNKIHPVEIEEDFEDDFEAVTAEVEVEQPVAPELIPMPTAPQQ